MAHLNTIFLKLSKSYFKDIKSILCDKSSYTEKVSVKAAKQILELIESNIKNNYDRLGAIETYIVEVADTHLVDCLLPFRFLTEKAINQVIDRIQTCDELKWTIDKIKEIETVGYL